MAETIGEFFDRITGDNETQFSGEPAYNPYGDCIHYHWRQDEFYGDRIDDKLTVYRSIASGDAVGCQIKGVTALIAKLGDFGISLKEQDGTPLAMFLFASQATTHSSGESNAADREKMYQYLLEQVGKAKVELVEHAARVRKPDPIAARHMFRISANFLYAAFTPGQTLRRPGFSRHRDRIRGGAELAQA